MIFISNLTYIQLRRTVAFVRINHSKSIFTYQLDVRLLIQRNLTVRWSISDSFVWKINNNTEWQVRICVAFRCRVTCRFVGKNLSKESNINAISCYYSAILLFTHLRQSGSLRATCWSCDRSSRVITLCSRKWWLARIIRRGKDIGLRLTQVASVSSVKSSRWRRSW